MCLLHCKFNTKIIQAWVDHPMLQNLGFQTWYKLVVSLCTQMKAQNIKVISAFGFLDQYALTYVLVRVHGVRIGSNWRTLSVCGNRFRQEFGSRRSTALMSLEKRTSMRPVGVVSKKRCGRRITPYSSWLCSRTAASFIPLLYTSSHTNINSTRRESGGCNKHWFLKTITYTSFMYTTQ